MRNDKESNAYPINLSHDLIVKAVLPCPTRIGPQVVPYPATRLRPSLDSLCRFGGCEISGAMIFASFAKKLADHLFHGHFLNVNVAHVAGFEQFTTGFGDFRTRNFQLD